MNGRRREVFASLAELLVPAGGGMPSARDAGAAHAGIDRVLAALPEVEVPLCAILDRALGSEPAAALADLHRDRASFDLLALVAAGAYLTEPVVMGRLGYRGRPVAPVTDDLDDEVLALLEGVLARGARFRSTPGGS